ncbi:hypothetical protein L1D15_02560 [Vibrio sp. Isolate25]|uniref:hypothetical protein n=1 Tax=unclassified Vibrio TaxID=2614977 RepID=UPI001EFE350E|nr:MULTISPECIES: hypothetical protein [unclassified Vibrio]MCG9595599.1 hypothetical protein [Vibrio sp. Isolate25]MCG9677096.1 hypothetical protein [Vibrio sp. Isolate24]MCG9681105.1 hypothetical protein [Vibrio sp. Isolate23]
MKFVSCLLTLLSSAVIANPLPDDEKLIASLIERGVICDNQTYEEKQESLQIYLANRFDKKNKNDKKDNNTNIKNNPTEQKCISAIKK